MRLTGTVTGSHYGKTTEDGRDTIEVPYDIDIPDHHWQAYTEYHWQFITLIETIENISPEESLLIGTRLKNLKYEAAQAAIDALFLPTIKAGQGLINADDCNDVAAIAAREAVEASVAPAREQILEAALRTVQRGRSAFSGHGIG